MENMHTSPSGNDTQDVKALLESLQASHAWKELATTSRDSSTLPPNNDSIQAPTGTSSSVDEPSDGASSNMVASLLAQLHSVPAPFFPPTSSNNAPRQEYNFEPMGGNQSSASAPKDRQNYTYQQALPVLANLALDPHFIDTITQVKKDQDKLERQLWEQRQGIRQKYEGKVKAAKARASIIGTEITKHEADMLSNAYVRELEQFDLERAIPLWDHMVAQQQERLAQAGVPAIFCTNVPADRQRQQRIIKVIEDLLS